MCVVCVVCVCVCVVCVHTVSRCRDAPEQTPARVKRPDVAISNTRYETQPGGGWFGLLFAANLGGGEMVIGW